MIIIGHRGAKGLAPENTLTALLKGIEHGVDELEFDVRVTSDGIPVLAHNAELHDASGTGLEVAETPYKTLLRHSPDLTRFDAVFDAVSTQAALYIEIKRDAALQPIAKVLYAQLESGYPASNIRIASFEYQVLAHMHELFPNVTIVVLERWSGVRATYRARKFHTKRIAMNHTWLWWGFIQSVSSHGYQLTPYTLNDPALAKRWQKHGMYGLVTDYPDMFAK